MYLSTGKNQTILVTFEIYKSIFETTAIARTRKKTHKENLK